MKRIAVVCGITLSASSWAATPGQYLAAYGAEAGKTQPGFSADGARGRAFAAKNWGVSEKLASCAACHTENLRAPGRHVVTGKAIDPLAPAVNGERFTDPAKVVVQAQLQGGRRPPVPSGRKSRFHPIRAGSQVIMKRAILGLLTLMSLPALADSDAMPIKPTPAYKRECGGCHAPFSPALLGAADWRKTISGLERHFGTDASLDADNAKEIAVWLERNAGRGARDQGKAEPRITTTRWFAREHDEVPARVWNDARVKSPVNCGACHKGADQGRYGESELVVPGLSRRHERDR
jgi:hypothetical protein